MTPNPPEFTPETISRLQKQLLHWYGASKRTLPWRQSRDPYAIWVSEVMLQQTQVKTVIPYYLDFMAAHPDIRALARADLQTILKSWEGLGYYARARNFHRAANIIVQEMGGRIPKGFDRFKTLPGVGDYIASAVQSIAFGHAHAVVDGNVKRVLARLLCMEAPVNTPKSHGEFKAIAEPFCSEKTRAALTRPLWSLGPLSVPRNPRTAGPVPYPMTAWP